MVRCNACGGVYAPVQADGTSYYHVCPPLSAVELAVAVDEGRATLPKDETPEDAVLRRTYERPNKRDETVVPARERDAPATPRLEGAGVTELAAVDPIDVTVR